MFKVGITGGVGTGKSTVASVFASLGIPIYSADARAKILIEEMPEIVHQLINLFGNAAYLPDGRYNKTYIAGRVFENPELLQKLNAVVHPIVGQDFENWAARQSAPYVLKEAAIMQRHTGLDKIIVVSSPLALRIQRIKWRDGRSEEQIENIIRNQKTEEEFMALADYTIVNNEQVFIAPQVLEIDRRIRREVAFLISNAPIPPFA